VASVASVVGASSISSVWGPRSWQGAGNIAGNAGLTFLSTAGFNVIREFLPDMLGRPRKERLTLPLPLVAARQRMR
jgi:hypothetical protein